MRRLLLSSFLAGAVAFAQALPQGFPQQGFPQQGFPQQGFPQSGFPQQAPPQGFPQQSDDQGDAPDHAVARISFMNGNVTVAHGDSNDLAGASINAPLVTSDRILTGENGRVEVQFDAANMIRLAPSTEVRMGDLQDRHFLIQIAQGLVTFRVFQPGAQVEISTPSISVHPVREGVYRVLVRPDGSSEVTVRQGEAEVSSPTGSEPLRQGQTMMSRGPANDPEFRTAEAIPYDDWDRWNGERDQNFERAQSEASRYVSPEVYGTEQMAGAGHWVYDPQYGNVWVPYEDPDWAPYRDGRWSYVDYYGWSWIGYEPWGWAPYHYGRWYRGSFGWAWWPGAIGPHQYWRPALVGFFGWGSPGFGVSFGFGFGNVGWVPLAPHEAFRPWYGRGFAGGRGVIVNNTNIAGVYRNARFTNAVTSVRAADFGRGAIGRNNFVRASAGDISRAGMMSGGVPLAASRESRQFASQGFSTQGMPRVNANTRFFSSSFSPASSSFSSPSRGAASVAPQSAGGWRRFDAAGAGASYGSSSRGFNNAGGFNNGSVNGGAGNNGGFRRLEGNAGSPQGNFGGGSGERNYAAPREQQPVRIAPPIVGNRNENSFRPAPSNGFDGFGGPRPNYGGVYSAPRAPQNNGGFRAPSGGGFGGGNRGGGGGSHGGGGHGGGRGR